MRIETDGNPKTSSPHLFARKLDESYVFELWVEKECIMGNMGLATSISSFLHLVFCFNLKYPMVRSQDKSSSLFFVIRNFPDCWNSLWFPTTSGCWFWKRWRYIYNWNLYFNCIKQVCYTFTRNQDQQIQGYSCEQADQISHPAWEGAGSQKCYLSWDLWDSWYWYWFYWVCTWLCLT